jgi:hypothetical protein
VPTVVAMTSTTANDLAGDYHLFVVYEWWYLGDGWVGPMAWTALDFAHRCVIGTLLAAGRSLTSRTGVLLWHWSSDPKSLAFYP